MQDSNVKTTRLYVATVALIRQRYPQDLAEVIVDDPTLPAWEEASAQAAAVIMSLKLDELFTKVKEVDTVIAEHESARKLADRELETLKRDMEYDIARKVDRAVRTSSRDYQNHIQELQEELWDANEALANVRAGIEVKRNIKHYGKFYSTDTDIMQDDDFALDYEDERYRRHYEW